MFRCPRCKSPDGYMPGEKCFHCGYLEQNQTVINSAKQQMKTDKEYDKCPRCNCPDAYIPGEACLHCQYKEEDPQIIAITKNAQLQIPRSALLRCPKCKNPDAYTPGEPCLHCKYKETNSILIKKGKELRYRLIPLMKAYAFNNALQMRNYTGSQKKYNPIAGALLEYEYAFALLFSKNINQIQSLQNLYRVLSNLDTSLATVLKGKNVNENNRNILTRVKQLVEKQIFAMKQEFNKKNWTLTTQTIMKQRYPKHVRQGLYFQKCTEVGDVLSVLNGMAEIGFAAANLLWNVSEAIMETVGTVTGIGSMVLAPFSVAENIVRGKKDSKLKKEFHGTAMKAGQTILDLPPEKQKQMIRDALNSNISGSQFAKKWGGRIDYGNVKHWNDAAEVHRKGKNRRTKRTIATIIGTSLAIGAIVLTCGTAAVVLGAGAATIAVLKVADSGLAKKKKLSKSEEREIAAREIIDSAVKGEINAINLLGGLGVIKDPNHAKYLGFSDVYASVIKEVKKFLDPA